MSTVHGRNQTPRNPTLPDGDLGVCGLDAETKALLAEIIHATEDAQDMAENILADPDAMKVERKGDRSVAGAADISIEGMYKDTLVKNHGGLFVGEESHESGRANANGYRWIVDPVDGTTNFSAGAVKGGYPGLLSMSCTSVALEKNGEPYIGVVRNLATGITFFAVKDHGAYVFDGQHIQKLDANKNLPFDKISLKPALAFGHVPSSVRDALKGKFKDITKKLGIGGSTRELGTAAYEFCLVACGALANYTAQVNLWDYAAAALIAKESGANVVVHTVKPGKGETLDTVMASHRDISEQMEATLGEALLQHRLRPARDVAARK